MATRRPCKLKFLGKIKSFVILRISVVRRVVSQATNFVADVISKITLRLLVLQAKLNELLYETRWLFVASIIVFFTKNIELPDPLNHWLRLVQYIPALLAGHQIRIVAEKYNIDIPDYIKEILVFAIANIIMGLPPF